MKKFTIAALVLVLATALLTGCGCMNSNAPTESTMMPTILPTSESSKPLQPTETTMATQESTMPESAPTTTTDSTGMTESGSTTETTQPMTRESGRVRSHVNGDF